MRYHLAIEKDAVKLIDKVEKMISQGWQPIGGVSITSFDIDYEVYAQAMINKNMPDITITNA